MHNRFLTLLLSIATASSWITTTRAESVWLDELPLAGMSSGWGQAQSNLSVTSTPLRIGGKQFERGVGTHANSECWIELAGRATLFSALVGVDDNAHDQRASLEFSIFADDKEVYRSGVCRLGDAPRDVRIDLAGVKFLELVVTDAGDGVDFDHANWAEAQFVFQGTAPRPAVPQSPDEEAVLLTPPPPARPRIHGPAVYGARPGSPFLYRIPATGDRPMQFAAAALPEGLTLDPRTGIIAGRMAKEGEYRVQLRATNGIGTDEKFFRIVAGGQLALTPPMGWNSWYIHYDRVSDKLMRQAADQMIATGMADFGYQYVNIDDCWMIKLNSDDPEIGGPTRDSNGRLLTNKRFPDMNAMTDYIHAKGLKAGTYISPGPWTCAGYAGSYEHEAHDAQTFAEWGFDFLKYDWCSYGRVAGGDTLEHLQKPYRQMWSELNKLDRDIVLNLCQYGMGDVWKWGGEVGHCWRTTGDLGLEQGSGLPGFYSIGRSNARHAEYAHPGAWNDPDYILIGWVGDARHMGEGTKTSLTPNEQYSYMSMWCLMAAPLIFSGDMAKLDDFTLNILCNHEVIAIDQDPLGKQARIVTNNRRTFILAKDLEDGGKAVGIFNLSPVETNLSVTWGELGITGKQRVRNLWRQQDMGVRNARFETTVARHGVVLATFKPAE